MSKIKSFFKRFSVVGFIEFVQALVGFVMGYIAGRTFGGILITGVFATFANPLVAMFVSLALVGVLWYSNVYATFFKAAHTVSAWLCTPLTKWAARRAKRLSDAAYAKYTAEQLAAAASGVVAEAMEGATVLAGDVAALNEAARASGNVVNLVEATALAARARAAGINPKSVLDILADPLSAIKNHGDDLSPA